MHGLHHLTHQDIDRVNQHFETRADDHDRAYLFELSFDQRDELMALGWYGTGECPHDFDYHRGHVVNGRECPVSPALLCRGLKRLEANDACTV